MKREPKRDRLRDKLVRGLRKTAGALFASGGVVQPGKQEGKHDAAPIEYRMNKGMLPGGTLADAATQKIAPHERIVFGMGSGGSEDVNTYALVDEMRKTDPNFGRSGKALCIPASPAYLASGRVPDVQNEGEGVPLNPADIGDVFARGYMRDAKGKLVPDPTKTRSAADEQAERNAKTAELEGMIQKIDDDTAARKNGK